VVIARRVALYTPGLGQLYNGDWLKGIGLLAASALLAARFAQASALVPVGLGVVWLWGFHDARRSAR
jgi:hypothetical protein